MSDKSKVIIAVGGTGGHVIPGCSLACHLAEKNFYIKIVTDKRGYKYLEKFKHFEIAILPSYSIFKKNIFLSVVSLIFLSISISRSLIFLTFNRPSVIFGMGGYASFPICIAASILRIKFIIYENNLVIGRANKYLLPFAEKIFVSCKDLEGVSKKYQNKVVEIGNILKKSIINFSLKSQTQGKNRKINILILGGSQAAKVFAEKLPKIFLKCVKQGIRLKVIQQCMPTQNESLNSFYKNNKIDFEIFNFSYDLIKYFLLTDLAITRSGSSMLAELTNANIPFISVPLPTSADNHQLKNALFYNKKKLSYLIEEKDLNERLFNLIKEIYENKSLLVNIRQNQKQFSDKNVYNNIDREIKNYL